MRTINKYPVGEAGVPITAPNSAIPVKFLMQGEKAFLYMEVPTGATRFVEHEARIFGTGHEIPDDWAGYYFDSVQDGVFVWHLYYRRP